MRLTTLKYWSLVVVAVWGLVTHEAMAGGPIQFNEADGRIFHWPFDTAVYVVEGGKLGVLQNQQLKESVDRSFRTWEQVPTSGLLVENLANQPDLIPAERLARFQKDITVEDFVTQVTCPIFPGEAADFQRSRIECDLLTTCVFEQNALGCPSPIIFDDPADCSAGSQENSIIKEFFGGDNTVIGFTNPFLTLAPAPELPEPFQATIVQAFVVVSGCFFSQDVLDGLNVGSSEGAQNFLDSVLVHEFGHFVGLAHSSVNGDIALLNPSVKNVAATGANVPTPGAQILGPLDPLTSVDANTVETMYPVNLTDPQQPARPIGVEQDDAFTLSTIYPCTDASPKRQAGQCRPLSDGTGSISGNVFILQPDQTIQPAQGVLVIARRVDGNDANAFVLKQAISQLTGNTFAPARCSGRIDFDKDGNGTTDYSLTGLFGPCTTTDQCTSELSADDGLIKNLATIVDNVDGTTTTSGTFVGTCGFISAGFTSPQPIGNEREGRFSLEGLAPGKYMIQALPITCPGCSFSSPLRSSLGLVDFVNGAFSDPGSPASSVSAAPVILADNNRILTFFPNPQIGESYNGPATGCDSAAPPCGDEDASSTDNPFAYTPLVVTAGGQISNVNIFLNTSPAVTFSDPGLNFCQLGDVNRDGKVNQDDILAVSKAQEKFAKTGKITNARADLNQDKTVTFIDVDIITDLVSIPRPLGNPASGITLTGNASELKRGIATFDAICTAAGQGGCEIQAPAEDVQADGTPTPQICDSAKGVCKVTGCP